ncbi:MAG: ATP synthase F1 subunit gamma [Chloroflexi bacterium]|nr:ATP synthase F1 subunit gamma [Chloroflexota bacterium]
MASDREIKRRIRSIKNIAQVTKAMEAVSASKMRRAQQQVLATRPYAQKAQEVLNFLAYLPQNKRFLHPLLQERPIERAMIILITADRGLAGGFNTHIIRHAVHFSETLNKPTTWVTVGRKGRDFMARYGYPIVAEFTQLGDKPTSLDIAPIARVATDEFVGERVDAVYVCYTDFVNVLRQVPVTKQLLPIEPLKPEVKWSPDYIFEPDPETILDLILYRFVELQILQAVYESIASEHAARMVAMRNATDAAMDLIDELTLSYNKARQERITREIIDIAGGAEALRQALEQ